MLSNTSEAKGPVFAIVISEKGGAERREAFEQSEVNIGRVQGNELMLPKGNVSKRHARLVFRDGRFIVTDMNSTNGTYVNRRRISQATIVRQGDRIYIGDFVLRIEAADDASGGGLSSARASVQPIPLREPMMTTPDDSSRSKSPSGGGTGPTPGYPPVPPAPRLPTPARMEAPSSHQAVSSGPPRAAEASVSERSIGVREDSIDAEATAYKSAVAALVLRVSEKLEAGLLDKPIPDAVAARVDKAIVEQLAELRRDEVVGAAIAEERLKTDVRAELVGLGPLGPMLEDETVTSVAVAGSAAITATRGGSRVRVEPSLSSEASVRRILQRILRPANVTLAADATLVTQKLPNGFALSAVTGARAPSGTLIHLERTQRVDATLDDLVRAGAVSRAMATFLKSCMSVRANVLVVGPREAGPQTVAAALVSAATEGHVVALQTADLIVSSSVNVSHVDVAGTPEQVPALVEFARRLPDARLVVDQLRGPVASAVIDAVSGGANGLVAVLGAGSLRRGASRLAADLAGSRQGLGVEAAREWVAGTFDVLVEVARLRDGRQRVIRIAEPAGVLDGEIQLRDVFTFVVERTATGGSVEGSFQATGTQPRIVSDMSARGIHVDSGVFSRPPSR